MKLKKDTFFHTFFSQAKIHFQLCLIVSCFIRDTSPRDLSIMTLGVWVVLLTYSIVFMLTKLVVGGSEKVQTYAEVIYGWSLNYISQKFAPYVAVILWKGDKSFFLLTRFTVKEWSSITKVEGKYRRKKNEFSTYCLESQNQRKNQD